MIPEDHLEEHKNSCFPGTKEVICLNNLAFFQKQSRCIYGISDRALILLRYRQPVKNINVVSMSHPGEFKVERIHFAEISRMTVMRNKDGSGHLLYELRHEPRMRFFIASTT